MDDFVRDLKKRVGESLGQTNDLGEINPLVVIGLTEAMLDLGLNEDQMYVVVKGYLRQLAGQIHPDRDIKSVSEDRQRQIFQAFEILDDRGRFSRALAEFRSLKSEDRKEANLLRETLAMTKDQLSRAREKELAFVRDEREFGRRRDKFHREEIDLRREIPLLNAKLQEVHRVSEKHFKRARYWKRRSDCVTYYVNSICADQTTVDLGIHAYDARWVAVASIALPEKRAKLEKKQPLIEPSPVFDSSGEPLPAFIEASQKLGISNNEVNGILGLFKEKDKDLNEEVDEVVEKYNICLTLIELSGGKLTPVYGWNAPFLSGRVLGSISPKHIKIGLEELSTNIDREVMFEKMLSNLTNNGLLVMGTMLREKRYSSGVPIIQFMRFDTKHLILGVG